MTFILSFLMLLTVLDFEPQSLESVQQQLTRPIGEVETNCFSTSQTAFKYLAAKQNPASFSNRFVEVDELFAYIKEETKELKPLTAIRIAAYMPSYLTEDEKGILSLPFKHSFIILWNETKASLCQSWEQTEHFSCHSPMSREHMLDNLSNLQNSLNEYESNPNQITHASLLKYFLGGKSPFVQETWWQPEELQQAMSQKAVKFLSTLKSMRKVAAFFDHVIREGSRNETLEQLDAAELAGVGVIHVDVMHFDHPFKG